MFRLAFQYDLAFGVLDIVLGIVLLICPSNALTFAYIALGLCVLADGLFKVQIAIDAKHFGITAWWAILLAAIFTGAIGAALIFRPSLSAEILTVLVGVYMLLDGILNLITVLSSVRIVNHQFKDDVIEAEFREVDPERNQDV